MRPPGPPIRSHPRPPVPAPLVVVARFPREAGVGDEPPREAPVAVVVDLLCWAPMASATRKINSSRSLPKSLLLGIAKTKRQISSAPRLSRLRSLRSLMPPNRRPPRPRPGQACCDSRQLQSLPPLPRKSLPTSLPEPLNLDPPSNRYSLMSPKPSQSWLEIQLRSLGLPFQPGLRCFPTLRVHCPRPRTS